MLSLTISKFLTAVVSFLTAITLLTLIPQLLRVKLRENFLRIKAHELNREVGLMKRKEEASWHVRMLTQEIRRSLDKHTILYTTLVELSKTLDLQNCAVWMPNEDKTEMGLTHELSRRNSSDICVLSLPMNDPDVMEVTGTEGAKILKPDSLLGCSSSGAVDNPGAVAAIRMPMLKVSDFKGGTPKVIKACYAILVLVIPKGGSRIWSSHELEIIEVVADQVAVALSHSALLEESHLMRDKLIEQNRALQQAKQNVMMACEARNSFQRVISQEMRKPIHSILGLLYMMQLENLTSEQRLVVDAMTKTGTMVSTLINDVIEMSAISKEQFSLEMRPFRLQQLIKEAASVAMCLCNCKGFGFSIQVEDMMPDHVVGDERRILHVFLHIIGVLLDVPNDGHITLRVWCDSESEDQQNRRWAAWKSNFSSGYGYVKFEIAIKNSFCLDLSSSIQLYRRSNGKGFDLGLSFRMCERLVQLMQGNILVLSDSQGLPESMTLALRLQLQPASLISELGHLEHPYPSSLLEGFRVLLADDDRINSAVTGKLLEKLGCCVSSVSSGTECLSSLASAGMPFQLVILDLDLPILNGFEVGTRIRNFRNGRWPLVIALTESAEVDVRGQCLQSGIHGLITKPVILQAIKDELLRVLQNT